LHIHAKDFNPATQSCKKFKESRYAFGFLVTHTRRKDGFILDGTVVIGVAALWCFDVSA
jgi:hypothetical protein